MTSSPAMRPGAMPPAPPSAFPPSAARRWAAPTCAAPSAASCPTLPTGSCARSGPATPTRRGAALARCPVGGQLGSCDPLGRRGGRRPMNEIGPNFIARPYRGVSVQYVETLEPDALRRHLLSRPVYRRTEFIVAVHGDARALVQLEREEGDEILVPVRDARVLAGPRTSCSSPTPPSTPATRRRWRRAARRAAARRACTSSRAASSTSTSSSSPRRCASASSRSSRRIRRSCSRWPSVLDFDEDLPPVDLELEPIDLLELAAAHPAEHYLFPCRCAGLDLGVPVDFLDPGPPSAAAWTLVGCERSRQIHAALYGRSRTRGSTSARCRRGPAARLRRC